MVHYIYTVSRERHSCTSLTHTHTHTHTSCGSYFSYSRHILHSLFLYLTLSLPLSPRSAVKPFLHSREKNIIFVVLLLQVCVLCAALSAERLVLPSLCKYYMCAVLCCAVLCCAVTVQFIVRCILGHVPWSWLAICPVLFCNVLPYVVTCSRILMRKSILSVSALLCSLADCVVRCGCGCGCGCGCFSLSSRQVVDNVAMIVIEETSPGSVGWLTWR